MTPAGAAGEEKVMLHFILLVVCGILVGGGAILPGISGGVLCVIFGVYRPLMEFLSNPVKNLKKHFMILLPLAIGWPVGFWGFARLTEWAMDRYELYTVWLFIGLIAGTFPALFKQAGAKGRTKFSWIWFGISFVLMFGLQALLKLQVIPAVQPNFFWYIFCGVLWGLSLVVPGMTSSSTLMAMGLYEGMNAGFSNLDIGVILPWILGLAGIVLLTSRLVTRLFEKHYSCFYHVVLGIVVATTVVIVPLQYKNATQLLVSLVAFVVGCIVGGLFEKFEPSET